jgi:hypothetical protein
MIGIVRMTRYHRPCIPAFVLSIASLVVLGPWLGLVDVNAPLCGEKWLRRLAAASVGQAPAV